MTWHPLEVILHVLIRQLGDSCAKPGQCEENKLLSNIKAVSNSAGYSLSVLSAPVVCGSEAVIIPEELLL